MHLPQFEYARPAQMADALALLGEARGSAAILAGGTDLMASMGQRLIVPKQVISIAALTELRGVEVGEDGSVRIGAATTLTELAEHPQLAAAQPMFVSAIRSLASVHVRNVATLGGNLALPTRCWFTNQTESWRNARASCFKTGVDACHVLAASHRCVATNSADSVPALIALNARITLASQRGARDVAIADFYTDDGVAPTVLAADELITGIHIPACIDRSAYIKVTPRQGIDFGLGNIAVRIAGTNRRIREACLVVNSFGVQPMRLRAAESLLRERGLTRESIDAAATLAREDLGEITSLWSPAGYKRRLVRSLLRRSLDEIRRQRAARTAA